MKRIIKISSALLFLIAVFSNNQLPAQEYRKRLKEVPLVVCKDLLKNIDQESFGNPEKKLKLIQPFLDSLKLKYNKDLKKEVIASFATHDSEIAREAVAALIYFNMKEILDVIIEHDKEYDAARLKAMHKIAYMNYLLLSKSIIQKVAVDVRTKKKGILINSRIKRLFKTMYLALGKRSAYNKKKIKVNFDLYKKCVMAVQKECIQVFPSFKVEIKSKSEDATDKDKKKGGGDA